MTPPKAPPLSPAPSFKLIATLTLMQDWQVRAGLADPQAKLGVDHGTAARAVLRSGHAMDLSLLTKLVVTHPGGDVELMHEFIDVWQQLRPADPDSYDMSSWTVLRGGRLFSGADRAVIERMWGEETHTPASHGTAASCAQAFLRALAIKSRPDLVTASQRDEAWRSGEPGVRMALLTAGLATADQVEGLLASGPLGSRDLIEGALAHPAVSASKAVDFVLENDLISEAVGAREDLTPEQRLRLVLESRQYQTQIAALKALPPGDGKALDALVARRPRKTLLNHLVKRGDLSVATLERMAKRGTRDEVDACKRSLRAFRLFPDVARRWVDEESVAGLPGDASRTAELVIKQALRRSSIKPNVVRNILTGFAWWELMGDEAGESARELTLMLPLFGD